MMSEWSVKQIHALQWIASNENAQGHKDEKKTKTKKTIRNQYSSSSRNKKPHETNTPLRVVKN